MRTPDLILATLLAAAFPAAAAEPVFTDVTESAGIAALGITLTESVAWGDYDNDGDPDLVITGDRGDTRLWRNDTPREHRWLGVRLRGAAPNTSAIGARVELRTAAGAAVRRRPSTTSSGARRGPAPRTVPSAPNPDSRRRAVPAAVSATVLIRPPLRQVSCRRRSASGWPQVRRTLDQRLRS